MRIRVKRIGTSFAMSTLAIGALLVGAQFSVASGQQSIEQTGNSNIIVQKQKRTIVKIAISARRSANQLIPRVHRSGGFDQRIARASDNSVISLELKGAILRFDSLSGEIRNQLETRFGKNAGSRYEKGIALQLLNLVNRIHATHPDMRVGVIGLPIASTDKGALKVNANYSKLIHALDVLFPRTGKTLTAQSAKEALSELANGRQVVPVQEEKQASAWSNGESSNTGASQGTVDLGGSVASGSDGSNWSGGSGSSGGSVTDSTPSFSTKSADGSQVTSEDAPEEISQPWTAMSQADAVSAMFAVWGTSDATWDLNGDGIVSGYDLAILLAHYDDYNDSGDDSNDSGTDDGGSSDSSGDDVGDDGSDDGSSDGSDDGSDDGSSDGSDDGSDDGSSDGSDDGSDDGSSDGSSDGSNDGPGSGSSGGDIQELVPGPGFMGATQQPNRQGSSSSPGYGAKSIARWTELPYITRDEDFFVTVSAFHMTDINRVEFILDDGEPIACTEVQPHPDTGYAEYIVFVDVSDLAVGMHEIRAIAYPNHGEPRVLQGTTYEGNMHVSNNGNESFWFTYHPNPTTAYVGGPNGQFETIDDAVSSLGSDLYAGRIYLSEGSHPFFKSGHNGFRNTELNQVLTISAAPSADPMLVFLQPSDGGSAPRYSSVHIRNVSVITPMRSDSLPAFPISNGPNRLMLEGLYVTSTDPDDGWANLDNQRIAKPGTSWSLGLRMKDCQFVNVVKGITGVMMAKNISFKRFSADAFGGAPGAVINCRFDMADGKNSYHEQHLDLVQISVNDDIIENRIMADLRSTNSATQIGHISVSPIMRNIAFIRWTVDNHDNWMKLNIFVPIKHLVMDGCTFRGGIVAFRGPYTNVLLRDMLMQRYNGGEFDQTFDPSTRIIEGVHFTEDKREFVEATEGPVTFAALSPPLGVPSDGSGMYIPTLVQTPGQITNQFLGNLNCEHHGSYYNHYYYDQSLLDLTWWRN